MTIDKKLLLEDLNEIKRDVDVLMQAPNTDSPNSPEWHRKRAKLQEAAFMKGQELFKSGNFERRA